MWGQKLDGLVGTTIGISGSSPIQVKEGSSPSLAPSRGKAIELGLVALV